MCGIVDTIISLCLVGIAYRDWKTRRISVIWLGVLSVIVSAAQIYLKQTELWSILCGTLIGFAFFMISRCTNESIGYGDSWLITILGVYLGADGLLEVMLSAGLGASLFSVWKLFQCGWNRKISIPFAPFLAAAYVGTVYL